ncbi:22942_t:CDS:2, partial [Gigaspora margarita]
NAHSMGLYILLDNVHSHACKNVLDEFNMFNSSDYCYFHEGEKGIMIFGTEYKFDGFKFNSVTSMIYIHHSICMGFSDNYHKYFDDFVDKESVMYLML